MNLKFGHDARARVWRALIGLLIGFFGVTHAMAQSQASTGQIVVTVLDPQGAAIVGAQVTVSNPATGLTRTVQTNDVGQFRLVLLPPGTYDVTIEATGFQRVVQKNVVVSVGSSVDVNVVMSVGSVSEVVEVQATIGVETTRQESGAVVNNIAIRDLPINGRRFQDFVTLTPAVQIEPQRNQISFSGQRGINSNISIDGADYNNPFFGGIRGGERSNNAFTIPQESVGEFQVVAAGFNAEFGRSSGGIVNVITKSGTNEYHGSAFYQLRHKELNSKDALGQLALGTQHQFGGSIGGPIVREKMFFFGSAEFQEFSTPRRVLFARLIGVTPTPETQEAFNLFKSLEGPFTQTNDAQAFLVRTDNQFGPNHRLAVRYNFSNNKALNANATGDAISPLTNRALSNNGTEKDRTNTIVGQFSSIFTPTVINELRVQYSRELRPREANARLPNVDTAIGNFGSRNFLPTTLTDWRFQISQALTWNAGRHSFKFGGEWNHTFADQIFGFNQFGAFVVSGTNVDAILRTLSRTPGVATDNRFDDASVVYRRQLGNLALKGEMDEIAAFGQDSWRIRNNFTLYYGLRYEAQLNPEPEVNNTSVYELVRNFNFPRGRIDPARIPDNTDQWMPRLGFAWDPFSEGKTVIRANIGIYYARTPLLLMASPLNNFRLPPGDLSIQLPLAVPAGNPNNTVYRQLLAIGVDLNRFNLDNLPIISIEDVQRVASALGLPAPNPFSGANLITWAPNYRNPRALQWSAGVEHELFRGFTTGAEFSYVNTVNLQRSIDYNLPVPIVRATDRSQRPFFGLRSRALSRPIPTLGTVLVRESSAHALYRGFTFRAGLQRSRIQFQAFYTLSWNYSDDDNERSATGQEDTNDAYNLRPEYHYSRLDARHLFSFNGVYSLPLGFDIGAIWRVRSARPLNPLTGADTNEDFFTNDRPMRTPGELFLRNSFRDRATQAFDLRILKGFNLWNEQRKLQLSVEFFNLFNSDNVTFGSQSAIYGLGIDPATGQPAAIDARFRRLRLADGSYDPNNTPGTPFQAQVGVRFIF
ncbi:MAG: carboxypeptidase regulatory-like domain-containing protein [Acidobacteriota bacterium]|nr:carboxypeptidase regulatory-like domain-containing protein [Blastocatellia bacterium]MDW8238779.1 carboxypeptidase regulatory-like domain-containing protein [Acidobacteriota bacterium]